MKVVVMYETMFGNTESLARSVADGLESTGAEVTFVEAGLRSQETIGDCDLLVLAAPTHALTLSRPESRTQAVSRGADPRHAQPGLREWLSTIDETLPPGRPRPEVAVFDTRISKARHWPGSAAGAMARILRRHQFRVVDRASFFVEQIAGPVASGEHDRAQEWGTTLAHRADVGGSSSAQI